MKGLIGSVSRCSIIFVLFFSKRTVKCFRPAARGWGLPSWRDGRAVGDAVRTSQSRILEIRHRQRTLEPPFRPPLAAGLQRIENIGPQFSAVFRRCGWRRGAFFLPQIASFGFKNASRGSGPGAKNADAVAILLLGALLPTLLFVPVPSRLIYYSLPTQPPFAILAAGWWMSMDGTPYRRGRQLAGFIAVLLGLTIAAAGQVIGPMLKKFPEIQAAP